MGIIASFLHGAVTYYVNHEYGHAAAIKAAISQAVACGVITLFTASLMELTFSIPKGLLNKYLFSFIGSGGFVLTIIVTLHTVMGTPNVMMTVVGASFLSFPYYLIYPLILVREYKKSLIDNEGNVEQKYKLNRLMTFPYNVRDTITVFYNNLTGPSNSNERSVEPIPQQHTMNTVKPIKSILFLGDFLSMKKYHLEFDERLKALAEKSDYVVVNLEGVVTDNPYISIFYQQNILEIFLKMTDLKSPESIIISVANNHSADHGYDALMDCIRILSDKGFCVIGTKEQPSFRINDDITITAITEWSNQKNNYLAGLEDVTIEKGRFNILFPHWGHELELQPRVPLVDRSKDLLKQWDMIVGHHSHIPQAISSYQYGKLNKLVAYSLGDFATQFDRSFYRYGAVLLAEIGVAEGGELAVGNTEWYYSYCSKVHNKKVRIELKESCEYF